MANFRPTKESIYVAEVGETAAGVAASTELLDKSILSTIQKMLARAGHAGANETEAKIALRKATKLMLQFNITRAEVLAHDPEGRQQYTGQSHVNIYRRDRDPNKSVMMHLYVDIVASAISSFFGTKWYSTSSQQIWFERNKSFRYPLVITFYGIAENTVAAAHAFEMTYNLLVGWSLRYKGTSQRNSYCLGVGRALWNMAKKEKDEEERAAILAEKNEEARRIRQEEADEQARLNRLNPVSVYELAGDDDGFGAGGVGVQDAIDSGIDELDDGGEQIDDMDEDANDNNEDEALDTVGLLLSTLDGPESPPDGTLLPNASPSTSTPSVDPIAKSSSKQPNSEPEPHWANHAKLIAYRNTEDKWADEFLEENGVKLFNGRARKISNLDKAAFNQGKKDAKNIPVRRRALKE